MSELCELYLTGGTKPLPPLFEFCLKEKNSLRDTKAFRVNSKKNNKKQNLKRGGAQICNEIMFATSLSSKISTNLACTDNHPNNAISARITAR